MNQQPSQQASLPRSELSAALAAAYPSRPLQPVFRTVEQFAAIHPAFTPAALRNLIFRAEPRQSSRGEIPGNGLAEAGAIVRLGRRVLINEQRFLWWIAQGAMR